MTLKDRVVQFFLWLTFAAVLAFAALVVLVGSGALEAIQDWIEERNTPTWTWAPVPSQRFTVQRASFVNTDDWSPISVTETSASFGDPRGNRISLYVNRQNWYWVPMAFCAVDNQLAAKFADDKGPTSPLRVADLDGVPTEGLLLRGSKTVGVAWCAKPDPKAEQIYEVVLKAKRGLGERAALESFQRFLATWHWTPATEPPARPSDPSPQIGVPAVQPPPIPQATGGRIAVPAATFAAPWGWTKPSDAGLFNTARLAWGDGSITVDLAGEATPEEACASQVGRIRWLLDPRPASVPEPETSAGGPAALRTDVGVSDDKRSWHVTCFSRDGHVYVVTAVVTPWLVDPRGVVDAVLASWTWA